ncbi:MAG: DUF4340 domain-containing protein [Elusimicrobiaceae bacterium]
MKNVRWLLWSFVIVTVLACLARIASMPDKMKLLADPQAVLQTTEITIAQPDGTVINLKKAGGTWLVSGNITARADRRKIAALLSALRSTRLAPELTKNPANFASFGMGDGIRFSARTPAGPLTEFTLGKRNGPLSYFLYNGAISEGTGDWTLLAVPPSGWMDKTILAIMPASVTGIDIEGEPFLQKNFGQWKAGDLQLRGDTVSSVITPILAALSNLQAEEILCAETACAAIGEKPQRVIRISIAGKYDPVEIKLYPHTDARRRVTVAGRNAVYAISEQAADTLRAAALGSELLKSSN